MKQGSFTQQVKNEICEYEYDDISYLALLSGFIKTNGILSFSNDGYKLILKTENSKIAKCIFEGIKTCFDVTPSFSYSRKMKLDKGIIYQIIIDQKVMEILEKLEISPTFDEIIPKDLLVGEGARFFLAGVFLSSGSVNAPTSSSYHLQMIVQEEDLARKIIRQLNKYKNERSMDFKYIQRRSKYIVYLKKADQITTFLALVNATISMLDFENVRVEKDFLNSDNRYQICYNANYRRMTQKANEQIEDIKVIEQKYGLNRLQEKERIIARIRLESNEYSLQDIASIAKERHNIKTSKSGVSRILDKLQEQANVLRRRK